LSDQTTSRRIYSRGRVAGAAPSLGPKTVPNPYASHRRFRDGTGRDVLGRSVQRPTTSQELSAHRPGSRRYL
jgi:hypothetical protein